MSLSLCLSIDPEHTWNPSSPFQLTGHIHRGRILCFLTRRFSVSHTDIHTHSILDFSFPFFFLVRNVAATDEHTHEFSISTLFLNCRTHTQGIKCVCVFPSRFLVAVPRTQMHTHTIIFSCFSINTQVLVHLDLFLVQHQHTHGHNWLGISTHID